MKVYTILFAVGLVTASSVQAQFIQNLVDAAAPGDTVVIPPGTYVENVSINKDITLQGAGARISIIDGNQSGPVILVVRGTVTLSGLTMTRGGIANSGTLTVNDCAINGNDSISGVGNSGTLFMNDCTVSGNLIPGNGGGVFNNGTMILSGCTISGNVCGLNLAGNGGLGGGLLNFGTLSLNNCTVTANTATAGRFGGGEGGGIVNLASGTISCKSTIIANNSAGVPVPPGIFSPDFSGRLNSQGYNLIGNTAGTVILGITTGNLLNIDPALGPLQNNGGPTDTHALLPGSPAIDAGISGGPATDQRGVTRPIDIPSLPNAADGSDIGAYELNSINITCPADIAANNDPNQFSAVVNYSAPLVSGGTGNVVVVCNPPSGSVFPVGTTTVTCTATDAIGSTAACSFSITVRNVEFGKPLAWGYGYNGQLGDGNFYSNFPQNGVATPVQVSVLTRAVAIAGGGTHSLALNSDGTVWTWGAGGYGQLGDGNFYSNFPFNGAATPVQVSGFTGAVAIAGGGYHSLALKSNGAVWAWGYGYNGQLGDGNFYTTGSQGVAMPVQVSGLTTVTAIAGGALHSLALKSDGTVWDWGYGYYGQLGDGNFYINPPNGVATPVQVSGLTSVTAVAGGFGHSLALKSNGTVWAWGWGYFGQLGDGIFYINPPNGVATPVQVSGLSGVVAIAGGFGQSLALKSDGTVWVWGLHDPIFYRNFKLTGVATPVQVSGLSGVVAIAGGYHHSLARKFDGTVWAWGVGIYGQLGDGNVYQEAVATPVQVSSPNQPLSAIAAGEGHSLALPAAPANTPPVITCPSAMNVSNDPTQCSAVVNYPAPLVSGGTGNVVVVCNPPSGSVFPAGTTTVTCTATDGSGATAACTFNVTVNDTEFPVASYAVVKAPVLLSNPPRITGWFRLLATDNCDPDPLIYIKGSVGSFVAGPFHNGDQVEIAHGPRLIPRQVPSTSGGNIASIQLNGDALLWAVDSSGNASTPVKCK